MPNLQLHRAVIPWVQKFCSRGAVAAQTAKALETSLEAAAIHTVTPPWLPNFRTLGEPHEPDDIDQHAGRFHG